MNNQLLRFHTYLSDAFEKVSLHFQRRAQSFLANVHYSPCTHVGSLTMMTVLFHEYCLSTYDVSNDYFIKGGKNNTPFVL